MSCLELSDDQRRTLSELLAGDKPTDIAIADELRRWGWVMPRSFELTGIVLRLERTTGEGGCSKPLAPLVSFRPGSYVVR